MKLRIVSYNIHRAIGVDRLFRPQRIAEILEHHDGDIVLLQEVDEGVPGSRELDLAKELAALLEYPYFAVGHNVSLRKGRYGNATLSRYPILRERNIDLTIGRRKRRGCQHTTMTVESVSGHPHRLDVFNLHLGLSVKERSRQVGRLARSREFSALESRGACVVGGDFNDWRSLLSSFFVEALRFHCASNGDGWGERRCMRTYPSFSPRGALDRIYYRGSLRLITSRRCRLKRSRVASDHLPIIADFELH
ncbi:MAG: endonuclease/exonuclease/phosphatase family protein [Acidobacteriota bacterium]|nr:endonuclease/exonuclease/phosphatase family protein [Acidobacteriota bacterium]